MIPAPCPSLSVRLLGWAISAATFVAGGWALIRWVVLR